MALREDHHVSLAVPNGWYAVGFSRDLIRGAVEPIHYFGEDMVLFRTRSGEARVLDAFCPHLGAHIGHGGRVVGETVRCPFHGWQYDGENGSCVQIPYCDTIPKAARVAPWHVQEKNEMIFVWYHAEKKPPLWDFPELTEFKNPEWSEPVNFELFVDSHVQDMHENNNDPIHFQFVHNMPQQEFAGDITYGDDGRHYRIVNQNLWETPMGTFETSLVRDSWGVGMSAVRIDGVPNAGLLLYSSTTPIDLEPARTISRWVLNASNNMIDAAGDDFIRRMTEGVLQDQKIWANKVHRAKPVLCKGDKYLAEYRRWVKQFYTDAAPLRAVGEE